jgi:hypothetical protein
MRGVGGAEYNDAELNSAANGAVNAWQNNINQGHYSSAVVFSDVVARNFLANGHTNHEQVAVADGGWVGTASGASLPWETSLCTSLYTYPRGSFVSDARRKRGRYYLPPMTTGPSRLNLPSKSRSWAMRNRTWWVRTSEYSSSIHVWTEFTATLCRSRWTRSLTPRGVARIARTRVTWKRAFSEAVLLIALFALVPACFWAGLFYVLWWQLA